MFSIPEIMPENTVMSTANEKEEQMLGLEAFQGDSALIQKVNELNHLKTSILEVDSI